MPDHEWTPGELIRPPAADATWHETAVRLAIKLARKDELLRSLLIENDRLARIIIILSVALIAVCVASLVAFLT